MTAIMVQGTSSGAGKTTIATAICRALSDRGRSVAPFKAQNMSRYSHTVGGRPMARAQAVQAVAARCEARTDLNPILLRPAGDDSSDVYVNGELLGRMRAREYYAFARGRGLRAARAALRRLEAAHDIVVIEGAGSPAEINIGTGDIANMAMAEASRAAVILVADISRGGAFASIVGTMALLEARHRRLVRGILVNKFRGDVRILRRGYARLERVTKRPVIGTVPVIGVGLPEEDSMGDAPARRAMPPAAALGAACSRLAREVGRHVDYGALEAMACR
ncbi:MAG: cobyric acid synthase [Thaumarchaeota archaeon S14]|nr:MAG: cobyric acid synthase [Thaumarchaeota archaeon S14]